MILLTYSRMVLVVILSVAGPITSYAQTIRAGGQPAQLDIRAAGAHSIRVTLKPLSYTANFPVSPALAERNYPTAAISLREVKGPVRKRIGNLQVEVHAPLTVVVKSAQGQLIQQLTFGDDGKLAFEIDDQPILGMGEGGPKPERGVNWRSLPIEYDRRGRMHQMEPRWQSDAYGSRNPVALLAGTKGWGLFVVTPWVQVDLQQRDKGYFIPWQAPAGAEGPQTEKNQGLSQGKGKPPIKEIVPGLYDVVVFDAHDPAAFMKDLSVLTGQAAMPPRWALGYMQSHRTLDTDKEMMGVIDSFRAKKIPVDAVIYLGTGFTPKGWNTMQPSFDFNPEVFKRDPQAVLSDMHQRHVKVVMHMVPWDRDKLPTLQGTIPARPGEPMDASHIEQYWAQHVGLVNKGVDAFWPDEGDWFNLHERIKRHQLYYQGHLSTQPNKRPWSLQRNGYPGIAQWGGWVWSGDTESSWKTLEGQIAVGLNYSLSIGPYWGSDIGGFYPNAEKTGELFARWFQFGAFCGSFRAHGRTWFTALPWGYGLSDMGPRENNNRNTPVNPDDPRNIKQSEMSNPAIEPITKKYTELHYQLLPYTYTLAWEARHTGMPLMRALWLHYPDDPRAVNTGSEYLWGRDLLIAPVFEKGATTRKVYLPKGDWYDWWSGEQQSGGQTVTRAVDLATMPIYVRAGGIIPFDPVRQYADEPVKEPTTLRVYTGADGDFTLYEDDGISQEYTKGKGSWIHIAWQDKAKKLTLTPQAPKGAVNEIKPRTFNVLLLPQGITKTIAYNGKPVTLSF
ncbi:TIM-barrel domain-containing protein [Paraflavitalea pollutisoli]|uniref:glycoside hydrolase family 31 protein n=1 Tax=Paraflavitalea pollutisoli TaxID=3034143 RepID=UPI0023EB8606|nr:TIM-barrel domain-containing protein [Paraflavitalea sp. H1-2-19X]